MCTSSSLLKVVLGAAVFCLSPICGYAGEKGTTTTSCTIVMNRYDCRVIGGPISPPPNAVVTGVYVTDFDNIVRNNLAGFGIDITRWWVTASIADVPADVKPGTYATAAVPQLSFNGFLVGQPSDWRPYIRPLLANPDVYYWAIDFRFVVAWEVMPRFRTAFTGTPAVIRSGLATHVFARTMDHRLVEVYCAYPGAPWEMYDRSAVAGSPSIYSNPSARKDGDAMYVYATAHRDDALHAWIAKSGVWTVVNLSRAPGGQPVYGTPAVTSNNQVFARSNQGRLIQWGQVATTCAAPEQCWAAWSVFPYGPAMSSDPALAETPGALHVYSAGSRGQLLEFYKEHKPVPWQMYDHSAVPGARPVLGPRAVLVGNTMQVFATGWDGRLLQFYKEPNPSPWRVFDLSTAPGAGLLWGPPAVVNTGAMHMIGTSRDRRLLGWYKESRTPWRVFDMSAQAGGVSILFDPVVSFEQTTFTMYTYAIDESYQIVEFYKEPNPAPLVARVITRW